MTNLFLRFLVVNENREIQIKHSYNPYIKKNQNITKDEVQPCCEDLDLRKVYPMDHNKNSTL